MITRTRHVTFYLKGVIRLEGDWYEAECVGLPVVTQGKTDAEAMANLLEATQLFVEDCIRRDTLERVLLKYRWRPSLQPLRARDPKTFSLPVPLPHVVKSLLDECRA